MSLSPQRRNISFIVRLWAEYLEVNPPSWRGEIEALGSEQKHVFSNLQEVSELIQKIAITHKEDPS